MYALDWCIQNTVYQFESIRNGTNHRIQVPPNVHSPYSNRHNPHRPFLSPVLAVYRNSGVLATVNIRYGIISDLYLSTSKSLQRDLSIKSFHFVCNHCRSFLTCKHNEFNGSAGQRVCVAFMYVIVICLHIVNTLY
jgi:hypothetical protein